MITVRHEVLRLSCDWSRYEDVDKGGSKTRSEAEDFFFLFVLTRGLITFSYKMINLLDVRKSS